MSEPQQPTIKRKDKKTDAATGARAASIRALISQVVAFYFRAPIKAFFRSRVDYLALARHLNPHAGGAARGGGGGGAWWSWHATAPGLLFHAIRAKGWAFIPNQVLPPLLANVGVGAVLYTSYLQCLGLLHEPSSLALHRVFPPPEVRHTFVAGFVAGGVQSVFAAPLDALQARFKVNEMIAGKYTSIWHYSINKLRDIGLRGIFSGWTASLVKDSFSCALFFSSFEFTKGQLYYTILPRIYDPGYTRVTPFQGPIRPHYLIEPSFILAAGIISTFAQQSVVYPMSQLQLLHYSRLESLDIIAQKEKSHRNMFRLYYQAYLNTMEEARSFGKTCGGLRKYLYKGFIWNTVRQTPSTSAGLIMFEILRRKYADGRGENTIRLDGVPFLL